MMRNIHWAALAAALGLAACEAISTAPKGAPRVEVEVIYAVDDGFGAPLVAPDKAALREILREAVRPIADVGLRFYPVPSENYAEGQRRPEHVLIVRAQSLEVDRRLETEKVKGEAGATEAEHADEAEGEHAGEAEAEAEAETETEADDADEAEPEGDHAEEAELEEHSERASVTTATVRSIRCAVEVRFEKRRTDAPNLIIGESVGTGSTSPRRDDPSTPWTLVRHSNESNDTSITTDMLQRAFGDAATRGLGALQRPIDREFEVHEPEKKSGS